jgi:hypothetical protein
VTTGQTTGAYGLTTGSNWFQREKLQGRSGDGKVVLYSIHGLIYHTKPGLLPGTTRPQFDPAPSSTLQLTPTVANMSKRIADITETEFAERVAQWLGAGTHEVFLPDVIEGTELKEFDPFVVGLCLKRYGAKRLGRSVRGMRWRIEVGGLKNFDDWIESKRMQSVVLDGRKVIIADTFRDEEGRRWALLGESTTNRIN